MVDSTLLGISAGVEDALGPAGIMLSASILMMFWWLNNAIDGKKNFFKHFVLNVFVLNIAINHFIGFTTLASFPSVQALLYGALASFFLVIGAVLFYDWFLAFKMQTSPGLSNKVFTMPLLQQPGHRWQSIAVVSSLSVLVCWVCSLWPMNQFAFSMGSQLRFSGQLGQYVLLVLFYEICKLCLALVVLVLMKLLASNNNLRYLMTAAVFIAAGFCLIYLF